MKEELSINFGVYYVCQLVLGVWQRVGVPWGIWRHMGMWDDVQFVGKTLFVSHTKHTQQNINGSTSFTIDNMYYLNFRI